MGRQRQIGQTIERVFGAIGVDGGNAARMPRVESLKQFIGRQRLTNLADDNAVWPVAKRRASNWATVPAAAPPGTPLLLPGVQRPDAEA